ncbi:type VI secretion system contractile sheath large subunit [Paraglaciecola marina]|uniref:type VI secretion system contractile sheath large subunit n=1 Tax=Paraglaciecola marina TaxID=2500157 RepID=UPI00105F5F85|nr:type VI secretion system contractile sheath large subunit [Paraglaciecola marina]
MSDVEEATNQSPLATLGDSLNYQPAILESLLNKKQKLYSFEELKRNLNKLIIPITEEEADLKTIDKTISELTSQSSNVRTFIESVDDSLKTDVFDAVNKNLDGLDQNTSAALELVTAAKDSEEDDKAANLGKAQKAFLKLNKDLQNLSTQKSAINESLQSDKNLVLDEGEQAADYFLGSLATALFNDILPTEEDKGTPLAAIRQKVRDLTSEIDERLHLDMDAIIHDPDFKAMEANWVGLHNLIESTDWSADVKIDLLDCTKEELGEDLENNAVDLINSDFFKKVYVAEYDQFGGLPYGAIVGLYEFENTKEDRAWLSTMGKLANASHAPFISSVGPEFFGCKNIDELAEIKDLRAHMSHPRYERWQAMRDSEEAAYLGLTLPRFLMRPPYDPDNHPAGKGLGYKEKIDQNKNGDDFLWGNASLLFAKNMIHSFAKSGWCQYIRGPKGGGRVEHLHRYTFDMNGQQEIKAPIEMVIPDYRELAFAEEGFIPLIYRKGGSDACFFSSQSIKKPKKFKDPRDSENSQLVTNLSYTLSITRIAHYVKCIMRDNIGSAADDAYINNVLQTWLSKYVTTVVNPDDLTLRYYPFKAAKVTTTPQEGMIGWYNSEITILPHIQFEGLDVELKMDVRI